MPARAISVLSVFLGAILIGLVTKPTHWSSLIIVGVALAGVSLAGNHEGFSDCKEFVLNTLDESMAEMKAKRLARSQAALDEEANG